MCYNNRMDAITLAAVRRELDENLAHGRVQNVLQPDAHSLALEIFGARGRQWLLFSIDARWPRVHLLATRARRGVALDAPFLLQARKRLRGARLHQVHQPEWERTLHLTFSHPQQGETTLVAEIMGRWSNLILHDAQGVILTSFRHFELGPHSQRLVRPGRLYAPPPPQRGKTPLRGMTETDASRLLHQTPAGRPLWRALVAGVAGISPLAAREIVFRATGETLADVSHPNLDAASLMTALDWFRSLPAQGGWAPSIARDDDGSPLALAPYALTHLGNLNAYSSISAAAQDFYAAVLGRDSYAGRRQQVFALIEQARKKLLGRRISLGEQSASEEDVARLRSFGEWILTYAWQIQRGDVELRADTGLETLHIPLDPTLTPSENAQSYFQRYHKKKRAAEKIPALLAQAEQDLSWLAQVESDLHLADNAAQIEELRQLLLASGLATEPAGGKRPRPPRSQPIRLLAGAEFEVIIGRNALQNERITWKMAQPDDIWLHAQGAPGSHVIIRSQGREVPPQVVAQAAAWAAGRSQIRNEGKAAVIVTRKRHLRKIKGGRPGQVRVLQHRTLVVRPEKPPEEASQT